MAKLHYCVNGVPVTDQVVLYQQTRSNDDFIPIRQYYMDYCDIWYKQLDDYIDRETFESEFQFKLVRAVESFDLRKARKLAKKFGWHALGMFNRWFYHILSNWKSNIKTSCFRVKKRPTVMCPICGRSVVRIDQDHLSHYKTTRDLPSFQVIDDKIYKVYLSPEKSAICYGEFDKNKLADLNGNRLVGHEPRTVKWPWAVDGKPVVYCPIGKRFVEKITDDYLRTLSRRTNRYATPMSWNSFVEAYPQALIQAEVYSLDTPTVDDEHVFLRDQAHVDLRRSGGVDCGLEQIRTNCASIKYEHVFAVIDRHISNEVDREILKLIAIGHSADEVAESLEIAKSEVKQRIKAVREASPLLETSLYNKS